MVRTRFLLLLGTLGLLAASLYVAALFGSTPYAAVARLSRVAYYEYAPDGPSLLRLTLTPARYAALRAGSVALLMSSTIAALGLLWQREVRWELDGLKQECYAAGAGLVRAVRGRSKAELVGASALLLLLFGGQLVWLLNDPLSPDEIGSFDAFVHEGPAAIASFYPIPNNHVGYNLLSWLLSELLPGRVRLIMRLPSLLVAAGGAAFSYALLTRQCSFRVATWTTALFGFTKLAVLYAAAGRGYYLQLACLQVAFFSVLELLCGGRCPRLAWVGLIGTSAVGSYAIPTFALPLASLLLVLAAGAGGWAEDRRRGWGQVLLAGTIIGAILAVLYSPVGCVSGWGRLLGNRYVAAQGGSNFWQSVPAYLYETTGMLLGSVRPWLVAGAALLSLVPLVLLREQVRAKWRWVGWLSWTLVVLPAGFMLLWQVFIPARVLMYATYFFYLLLALGVEGAASRWPGRALAVWWPQLLLLALPLWRTAAFIAELPALFRSRDQLMAVERAYHWLERQPPGPVYIRAPLHAIMFHHYALLEGRRLTLDAHPSAGVRYSYVVRDHTPVTLKSGEPTSPARAAYRDAMVVIYAQQ